MKYIIEWQTEFASWYEEEYFETIDEAKEFADKKIKELQYKYLYINYAILKAEYV